MNANEHEFSLWKLVKWVGIVFVAAVFLLFLLYFLGVIDSQLNLWFGWQTKPAEIFDADRVEQVRTEFIERSEQLDSSLAQIVAMDTRIEQIVTRNTGKTNWPVQDKADYESLVQARLDMVTSYNRSCAQYNADWDNEYKSVVAEDLRDTLPEVCEPYVQVP